MACFQNSNTVNFKKTIEKFSMAEICVLPKPKYPICFYEIFYLLSTGMKKRLQREFLYFHDKKAGTAAAAYLLSLHVKAS